MYKNSVMQILSKDFEKLISGSQEPKKEISSDYLLYYPDSMRGKIIQELIKNSGPMYRHFVASVPYILEEQARVIDAILKFSGDKRFIFWEMDSFDGTVGRVMSELSTEIYTLSNSPNKKNKLYFELYNKNPNRSFFQDSSLFDVDIKGIYHNFKKFDFLYETAAFQFYGKDRSAQINQIKHFLRKDGICMFLEKINSEKYSYYENLKDTEFKKLYFNEQKIQDKKRQMLSLMSQGQINLDELQFHIKNHFKYQVLVWSSSNFIEIAASNSYERLNRFIDTLGVKFIPHKYIQFSDQKLNY